MIAKLGYDRFKPICRQIAPNIEPSSVQLALGGTFSLETLDPPSFQLLTKLRDKLLYRFQMCEDAWAAFAGGLRLTPRFPRHTRNDDDRGNYERRDDRSNKEVKSVFVFFLFCRVSCEKVNIVSYDISIFKVRWGSEIRNNGTFF